MVSGPSTGTGTGPIGIVISGPGYAVGSDLVVTNITTTTTAPAGSPTIFSFQVQNVGFGPADDAVATVDLSGLPANSLSLISSQSAPLSVNSAYYHVLEPNTGNEGKLTPVPGQPGMYEVDLGPIDVGSYATVNIMAIPTANQQALSIVVSAVDGGSSVADTTPLNNVALATASTTTASTSGSAFATVVEPVTITAGAITVAVPTTVTRAQAQTLSRYTLTTASGTPVKLRSASYNAKTHEVTLRLAHPKTTRTTLASLTVKGLTSTASKVKASGHVQAKVLSHAQSRPSR